VLVTHSIPEAQLLADTMVVLHRGRTLQRGSPEFVYRHPAEPDVARLMGHKNIFDAAAVSRSPDGSDIDWKGVVLRVPQQLAAGPLSFCVAADDVRLVDTDASGRGNVVDATVERAVAVGASVSLRARLGNGEALVLSAQRRILERRGVAVGTRVQLAIVPQAIHVMARAPAD
jgi:molybdate transport system ATP-binding protein